MGGGGVIEEEDKLDTFCTKIMPNVFYFYGFKWYFWVRVFFNLIVKTNFFCVVNQISKSSTQIRKCIDWVTNTVKWLKFWFYRMFCIFWYMYFSKEVVMIEFESKWVPEFMSCGTMKDDKVFGWEVKYEGRYISYFIFCFGIIVYFKTYL